MSDYCIYFDFDVKGFEWLQDLREQFDPLAEKLPPHVTLVFPFSSDLSQSDLIDHVSVVKNTATDFAITLSQPENHKGYCWFPVAAGREEFRQLHENMYTGHLEQLLDTSRGYTPHVTIGRWNLEEEAREQLHLSHNLFGSHTGKSCQFASGSLVLEKIDSQGFGEVLFRC